MCCSVFIDQSTNSLSCKISSTSKHVLDFISVAIEYDTRNAIFSYVLVRNIVTLYTNVMYVWW